MHQKHGSRIFLGFKIFGYRSDKICFKRAVSQTLAAIDIAKGQNNVKVTKGNPHGRPRVGFWQWSQGTLLAGGGYIVRGWGLDVFLLHD